MLIFFTSILSIGGLGVWGRMPPSHQKKEEVERKKEEKKRGIKREKKLNQSFLEHVVMGL